MVKLILEENGKRRAFRLGDGALTVGSGAASKLVVESPDVAEVHFELVVTGGSARLEPRPGVVPPSVDGKPAPVPVDLAPGARVEFGGACLWLEAEAEAGEDAPAPSQKPAPKRVVPPKMDRSVVRRSGPRVKRGLPTPVIVTLTLIVVAVAGLFVKYSFESEAKQGTGSVQAHIWASERQLKAGNLERAESELDDIPEVREITPEEATRIAEIRAEIVSRRAESERTVRNLTGTKFLDVMLKKYEEKWLVGTPQPSKVRFYMKRLAEFKRRWPDHPELDWIERQENRFRGFVDISAPPTWEDVEWEITHGLEQHIRNYKAAFELLDGFIETAEGDELAEATALRNEMLRERIAYHEDKMQQARYEYEKKEDTTDAVKWLLHAVIWIGDEEMANQAAGYLVKIPGIENHLLAYKEKYPERYAEVLEHPYVHELARRKGLIP